MTPPTQKDEKEYSQVFLDMMERAVGNTLLDTYKWIVKLNQEHAPVTRTMIHNYLEKITDANEELRKAIKENL